MEMKQCTGKCGETKPVTEFYKDNRRGGYRPRCKKCTNDDVMDYYYNKGGKKVKQKYKKSPAGKASVKKYDKSEKGKAYQKKRSQSPKGKAKAKRWAQSEKGKAANKRYRQTQKYKQTRSAYRKTPKGKAQAAKALKRRHSDPWKLAQDRIRTLTTTAMNTRGYKRTGTKTEIILTVDWDTAIKHLGVNVPGTHIDHIIPISWGEHGNKEELFALSCIWNLRRVPAEVNLLKNDNPPSPELLHPNLPALALEIYERERQRYK